MDQNAETLWPVLLLYNLDPSWPATDLAEAQESAVEIAAALHEAGHRVTLVAVEDADLVAWLRRFDPTGIIVLNICEELPGMPRSESLVASILEQMGFVYTGTTAEALALSWDKVQVNRRLDEHGVPTPRWQV